MCEFSDLWPRTGECAAEANECYVESIISNTEVTCRMTPKLLHEDVMPLTAD